MSSVGNPPDSGKLEETLRRRCVGCLDSEQQGKAALGLEFAVSAQEYFLTHLSALEKRLPILLRARGPGPQVLICTLQEAACYVKVHSPEGILYPAGASDQSSALALPPSGEEAPSFKTPLAERRAEQQLQWPPSLATALGLLSPHTPSLALSLFPLIQEELSLAWTLNTLRHHNTSKHKSAH